MKKDPEFNAAVIGGGMVGTVIGKMIAKGAGKVSVVISRSSSSAKSAGRFIGCRKVSTSLKDIPATVDLLFIATPHAQIPVVAQELSRSDHLEFTRLAACHTSGMMTSEELRPLEKRGATVFSFHPLQTFPRDFRPAEILPSVEGIYYGIDGTPKGLRIARRLARLLGGKTIEVPTEMREFYHAACVVASSHLGTMLWVLQRMYESLGGKGKDFYPVFQPIIEATLQNVSKTSPAKALGGPIARGGVGTVSDHLTSVQYYLPGILPYFLRMTDETALLALEKGSVTTEQAESLRDLVRKYQSEFLQKRESL